MNLDISPLATHHDRQGFDCGNDDINLYLRTMANQHNKKNIAKTHVLTNLDNPNIIMGFYTLSAVELDIAIKGYPAKIPAMMIGRLGVDNHYQGQGLSKLLLANALSKIKRLSQDAGIAFAVIDAKNDTLAHYYQKFGFRPTELGHRLIIDVNGIG